MIKSKASFLSKWGDIVISVVVGLLVALLLRGFVFTNVSVPSESMEPTIMTNDKLIGYKLAYFNSNPERGDIVTFDSPDDEDVTYVKRIIGLPGETLSIINGKVYINGDSEPLNETYVNQKDLPEGNFGPYVVPADSYFVMGDNRNNSFDSRYWNSTHFIKKDVISSKIIFRYYPGFKKIE